MGPEAECLDAETRLHSEHPEALRLWLRLLGCTQRIEKRLRAGLRSQFGSTLPRFDLMAQLERAPEGLKMRELSQRLMVSGGNVTAVTDQLVAEGLVQRLDAEGDRRVWRVCLTEAGRRAFADMARVHEGWVLTALEGLNPTEQQHLLRLLSRLKTHLNTLPPTLETEP